MVAVHPWLMSLRPDILSSKTCARPSAYPASMVVSMVWMVEYRPDSNLRLEGKQTWMERHSPRGPIPASTAAFLDRIRASRNR